MPDEFHDDEAESLRLPKNWHAFVRSAVLTSETSLHFLVSDDTIRDWLRRVDDDALVQTPTPVNGFRMSCVTPREQIKLFCPTLGKLKIAEKLARAGMHIGKSTVERILKERPVEPLHPTDKNGDKLVRIVSKYPGHTWNADSTAVPISGGFWTPWIPTAIAQRWPVCWWVLNVIDHFSRRFLGCGVFRSRPTSAEVTAVLDRIISAEQTCPKHLIVDQGSEFKCEHFEHVWCQANNILPRFGAVGQHGSIAVVERFHRTLKELLRLTTIPEDQTVFERELGLIIDRYNEHRPHETLDGKIPNEVHYARPAAHEQPRFEPRKKWPRGSPCAAPQVGVDGDPGDPIIFEVDCLDGRRHLPLIRVRRAA